MSTHFFYESPNKGNKSVNKPNKLKCSFAVVWMLSGDQNNPKSKQCISFQAGLFGLLCLIGQFALFRKKKHTMSHWWCDGRMLDDIQQPFCRGRMTNSIYRALFASLWGNWILFSVQSHFLLLGDSKCFHPYSSLRRIYESMSLFRLGLLMCEVLWYPAAINEYPVLLGHALN